MSQAELEAACRYWQELLRLQHWDVVVRLARQYEMDAGNQGECEWNLRKRMALIKVLDAADWDPRTPWPQDQEQTLVHELLHLHFAPFRAEQGTAEDTAQEQAIDAIARALVELKRGREANEHGNEPAAQSV